MIIFFSALILKVNVHQKQASAAQTKPQKWEQYGKKIKHIQKKQE